MAGDKRYLVQAASPKASELLDSFVQEQDAVHELKVTPSGRRILQMPEELASELEGRHPDLHVDEDTPLKGF
jgi:hypothetical protein